MQKVAATFSPIIAIDRTAARPLHRQIYDAYKRRIAEGGLRPGQQVPSTRVLSRELGMSRIPALEAYSQLLAEGYLESRFGIGTFVARQLPETFIAVPHRNGLPATHGTASRFISQAARAVPPTTRKPWVSGCGAFSLGQAALEHFPFRLWSRLLIHRSREVAGGVVRSKDPMSCLTLREAIAGYLRTSRALHCESDQIMVVGSPRQAIEITSRVLLDPGSAIWVEEPGCRLIRQQFIMTGCKVVAVPVDREGLNVEKGIELSRLARAAYVTPSHQFPLGMTLSPARRQQLLRWAQDSASWIIEDDSEHEYRYGDRPTASLQGLDENARVIYIGSFSPSLFPSLQLGWLVIPRDLITAFAAVRHMLDMYAAPPVQAALADFINQGHLARQIRRMRGVYAERRDALIEALQSEFPSPLEMFAGEAGTHLVTLLPKATTDLELCERAAREKLWLSPLSPCYVQNSLPGLMLGFAGATVDQIRNGVRQLRDLVALHQCYPSPRPC